MRDDAFLPYGRGVENLYPPIREAACRFFEERGIVWWRFTRGDDPPSTAAPTRHRLSSQVACVNFLFPLVAAPAALAAALRAVDSDVESILPIRYSQGEKNFESVIEFEWTGEPTLEGGGQRGSMATSADALVLTRTSSGNTRAYLIEWKYTEGAHYGADLGAGRKGETRRARYQAGFARSFRPDVTLDALLFDPLYQLMRLRLLADRMTERRELGIDEARVLLVRPVENLLLRTRVPKPMAHLGETIEEVFSRSVVDPSGFRAVSQAELLETSTGAALAPWRTYLADRYGIVPRGTPPASHVGAP